MFLNNVIIWLETSKHFLLCADGVIILGANGSIIEVDQLKANNQEMTSTVVFLRRINDTTAQVQYEMRLMVSQQFDINI